MFIRNFLLVSATSSITLSLAAPAQQQVDRFPLLLETTNNGTAISCNGSSNSSSTGAYWPGFDKLANVFAFGDSYTSPGFKVTGIKPTKDNPLGNTADGPRVQDLGSGVGPNWIAYLTGRDNVSSIATYNFAAPGATLDSRLAGSILPRNAKSLVTQVEGDWLPIYGARGEVQGRFRNSWGAEDSLFAIWVGINDVLRTYANGDDKIVPAIFNQYETLLGELYNSGARNFLLMDVPPLQDAPVAKEWFGSGPKMIKAVNDWNSRLVHLSTKFRDSHKDATVIDFSTNKLFTAIKDNPTQFKHTSGLKVVGPEFCSLPTDSKTNSTDGSCKTLGNQYFWLDLVHSSTSVHSALSFQIAQKLSNIAPSSACNATRVA